MSMAEVPNPMPSLICRSRPETRLEVAPCPRYAAVVSTTAEKLFEKAQALPEPAQVALLKLAEVMATTPPAAAPPKPKPQFGSARGLITIGPDFDEPLEDFKPYME